ncbi:UNVERIFIED_CONTAM: Type IV inositol polyphosphate 5-phosphatase 3 [Sesamum calycinum]|uniref:Type IV inositol polyphosphate 5-phosphatase 3 n=1 Tax=Sesamum calycinum TaxID=2727403 RepID=A0AAW2QMY8_9LAMI
MKKQGGRSHHQHPELSRRRAVVRKWLNIATNNADYSADSDSGVDSDTEQGCFEHSVLAELCDWPRESRFKNEKPDEVQVDANDFKVLFALLCNCGMEYGLLMLLDDLILIDLRRFGKYTDPGCTVSDLYNLAFSYVTIWVGDQSMSIPPRYYTYRRTLLDVRVVYMWDTEFSAYPNFSVPLGVAYATLIYGCSVYLSCIFQNQTLNGLCIWVLLKPRGSSQDMFCHMECWGRVPPDELDLDDWLDIDEPADVYVIGLQEIIPLNAGNIFGAEDSRPVSKWENIIRETLNRVPPATRFKSYSDPPSPSKFKLSEDAPDIEDEIVIESDSDIEEEIYPLDEVPDNIYEIKDVIVDESNFVCADAPISNDNGRLGKSEEQELARQFSSPKRLDRLNCLRADDSEENMEASNTQCMNKLTKTLSRTDRIGLSWPEPPLHLLAPHVLEKPNSFKSSKSFRGAKSFRTYSSFKSNMNSEHRMRSNIASLAELDLESLINRKRRPPFVRVVSKQMVGIFITVWVRRSLRRHIQNLNVSTVGVGVMGYIGNKGSISVSMSIHQTLFCFVCTHLTSGEKDGDAVKRNADVHEIHRRTRFNSLSAVGLPRRIYDHERIIWLGDLNYRINLSYEKTRELISRKEWSKLVERDQLIKELKKGRTFDGWSEGILSFAPTYKYELNSESYYGEDPKAGRRTPAWCDRILSFGTGMKLLSYRRSEIKLSDHRPVTASYMVEVEVFSPKKLQRALTFTDAEIEEQDILTDIELSSGMGRLRSGEVSGDGTNFGYSSGLSLSMGFCRMLHIGSVKAFADRGFKEAANGSIHDHWSFPDRLSHVPSLIVCCSAFEIILQSGCMWLCCVSSSVEK